MTVKEARSFAAAALEKAGVPDAAYDASVLLEWSTGLSKSHILAYPYEELAPESEEKLLAALKRRAGREPLQYITGEQGFMGLTFKVDRRVLIPRQDTETLVMTALEACRPGMRVLDLCTGSGCIAISLAARVAGLEVLGTDASKDALDMAGENAKTNGVRVDFRESDLFERVDGRFDLIVSNPPYIRSEEIDGLMDEVRLFEPISALDGDTDGLYFYRKIAAEAPAHLKSGGRLMLEIGFDQAKEVSPLLCAAGFEDINVVRDLSGHDRTVEGRYV